MFSRQIMEKCSGLTISGFYCRSSLFCEVIYYRSVRLFWLNKEKRIYTIEPKVYNGYILFNRHLSQEFFDQMWEFPKGKHDDCPDGHPSIIWVWCMRSVYILVQLFQIVMERFVLSLLESTVKIEVYFARLASIFMF